MQLSQSSIVPADSSFRLNEECVLQRHLVECFLVRKPRSVPNLRGTAPGRDIAKDHAETVSLEVSILLKRSSLKAYMEAKKAKHYLTRQT